MWKRGGRNSALDRAEALLTAKRSSRRDAGGDGASGATPRHEDTTRTHTALRPQSSPGGGGEDGDGGGGGGGGGSRFLKKAPPPAPAGSLSPVRNTQILQKPGPRHVSSSPTAALSKLAQIESRSHQQAQGEARHRTSSPPEAAMVSASVQPSSYQGGLTGKRFLKNKAAAVAVDKVSTAAAAPAAPAAPGTPNDPGAGVRPESRAAVAGRLLSSLEMKAVRVVSLESDEEDMKKLLGDSLDSVDDSLIKLGIPVRTKNKVSDKPGQTLDASRPADVVSPSPPSSAIPPHSPTSLYRRSSPFRFTGHAQAHFSPSALSPSPSPPCVSPSPPVRPKSARRALTPQPTVSSMSGHSEVQSLDELFPAGPGSEENSSERSSVPSEDFKINVMTLDDLAPASVAFSEQKPQNEANEREAKQNVHLPGSLKKGEPLPRREDKEEEQQQEEEEGEKLYYESDFESESKSEPHQSVSQVSEHLQGEDDGVDALKDQASNSGVSCERTEDDYSSTFSDTSSRTSGRSQMSKSLSGKSASRSSASHSRSTSSHKPRSRAPDRKVVKEAAVQTQPDATAYTWSPGETTFDPKTYINPSPVAAYTLSAETVDALSTFNPAAFLVNEMLKQQLAMTKRFMESSRHLHSSLLQSLEPPNYRYTTLENTMQSIRKHRARKLTTEEA